MVLESKNCVPLTTHIIEKCQINSLHTLFLNYFITCATVINEISEIRD